MKWFQFRQMNSDGYYIIDEERGIGHQVWVEAPDDWEANTKARQVGLLSLPYCECCGPRFYSVSEWDAEEEAKVEEPSDFHIHRYGEQITFLHYSDGRTVKEVRE